MQLAKENVGEATPGFGKVSEKKSYGWGMLQCIRRCLRQGGCSENGKERDKTMTRRGRHAKEKTNIICSSLTCHKYSNTV